MDPRPAAPAPPPQGAHPAPADGRAAAAGGGDGLVRGLTPGQCVAFVVGTLIGSGIFFVPHEMVQEVHSFGWIMAIWVIGGLLSLFGALAYAELGAMRPQAGGEYVYLRDGWGPGLGFLFSWGMFWIVRPASAATIAAGFALAAAFIWPALNASLFIVAGVALHGTQVLAAAMILLVTGVNHFGVRQGGRLQAWFTVLKIALIAALIAAALVWAPGHWRHLTQQLAAPVMDFGGVAAALVAALWAYDGWNNLTLAGSEIQNPQRSIPRAMGWGVGIVFLAYALVNVAYFYVLPPAAIAAHKNVAAAMAAAFLGRHAGALVSVAIMVSVFATLNSSILSGARAPFAMARDGYFFRSLARVHPRYRTPYVALWWQAVFCCAFALTGSYKSLFTLTIFAEWLFYALAVTSLFRFRRRGEQSPFRMWGYPVLPALFVIIAVIILEQTYAAHLVQSSIGLAIILAGIPFFFWWTRRHARAS